MEDYKSISESLGYAVCGYCGKRIRCAMAQSRGVPFHILVNEKGESCEPNDSCLGKQKDIEELKSRHPSQDII